MAKKRTPEEMREYQRQRRAKQKDDGIALTSVAHPTGPGVGRGRGRLRKASLETVEIDVTEDERQIKAALLNLNALPAFVNMQKRAEAAEARVAELEDEIARLKRLLAERATSAGVKVAVPIPTQAPAGPGLLSRSTVKLMSPAEARAARRIEIAAKDKSS